MLLRNPRRSWSCLLSWLAGYYRRLLDMLVLLGLHPLGLPPGDRPSPASHSRALKGRLTTNRSTTTRRCRCPCPRQRSLPVRVTLALSAPSHPPSEYIDHPQRSKTVSLAWPTQPPPALWKYTSIGGGLLHPLFLPPGPLAKRRNPLVESRKQKSNFFSRFLSGL